MNIVETVDFNVATDKEKRFLELVDGLLADSGKSGGIVVFNLHKCLPAGQHRILAL